MSDASERELELRARELDSKERGLQMVAGQGRSGRWTNPLTVAVIAAALAGVFNLWLAYENNRAQLALERTRAESERILEMLKAGDPGRARENLRFLLQLGLIQDVELRRRIEAWEANPSRAPVYVGRTLPVLRTVIPGLAEPVGDLSGRPGTRDPQSGQRPDSNRGY